MKATSVCVVCDKPFEYEHVTKIKRLCSEACKRKRVADLNRERYNAMTPEERAQLNLKGKRLKCAKCGKPMWRATTSAAPGDAMHNACRKKTPEELRAYYRARSKHYYKPAPLVEWECLICGKRTVSNRVGKRCTEHQQYKLNNCATCDKQIYTLNGRNRKAYCTDTCTPVATEKPAPSTALKWKQCSHCERWLCRPGRKFCNDDCARQAKLIRDCQKRRLKHPPRAATCRHCRTPIDYRRRTCDDCRARAKQARKGKHRARARYFGVEYETVNPLRVYERDKWMCGICKKPVNKRLKWPNQMCVSLDHVVAMANGGPHTYANTQCAHWLCNTLKSDNDGGQQLALVG